MAGISRHIFAACLHIMLAALFVLLTNTVLKWSAQSPMPNMEWVFVPGAVPRGAPFAAWYKTSALSDGGRAWVQLRICQSPGKCVLGARKPIAEDGGTGLVTAIRDLASATYNVEVLLVRRDAFGVPRTVQMASGEVEYAP